MLFKAAQEVDYVSICKLLDTAGLFAADCEAFLSDFLVYRVEGRLIACGGLEIYKNVALLRSLVVAEPYRGQGLAKALVLALEQRAMQKQVETLYLLTETADVFFASMGYQRLQRVNAPMVIRRTMQFSKLCDERARLMTRTLVDAS